MQHVVIVIHLMLVLALIGVVLLQKSEGGGLGIGGGGGGGMSGLMTGRSTANLLTRTTAIIAAAFLVTSLALAVFAAHRERPRSILDMPASTSTIPAPARGKVVEGSGAIRDEHQHLPGFEIVEHALGAQQRGRAAEAR